MTVGKVTVGLALLVGVCAAGFFTASTAGAADLKVKLDYSKAPNVYGGGSLMAYSGMEGLSSWAAPITAHTLSDGLGIRFDLPKSPTIHIRVPEQGAGLKWLMVTGDTLVASVPWDTETLVLTFTKNNVVAGRMPLNCRVSFEGGDSGAVLLKKEVEGRILFGFAYDPTPGTTIEPKDEKSQRIIVPAPAQTLASDALSTSVDGIVEEHLKFYNALPQGPLDANRLQVRTLEKAFSVLRTNLYAPEGNPPPARTLLLHWTTPSRWPQRDIGLLHTALASLGLMHIDVKLAKEVLQTVYTFQAENGMVPGRMSPAEAGAVSHPPLLGWAAWQVYCFDQMHDRKFLEASFDVAQKHVIWYMKQRRIGGEPPPTQKLEAGTPLYYWQSAEEAGMEGSPRFESGPAFAAIDLSCYLVVECKALQNMAQQLGFGELAKVWGARAEAIAEAARRQLWDNDRGFFFDRKGPGGEWINVWSAAGLLPLWAGIATPDQAARLKSQLLSKKFWTPLPVPVIARDEKSFMKDLWRGPVQININYWLIQGLAKYGYGRESTELREKTMEAIASWYGKTGTLWEYYDCDGEAPPAQLPRTGGWGTTATAIGDYDWTAALYVDMMLRPKP
jgi:hypothetical protein